MSAIGFYLRLNEFAVSHRCLIICGLEWMFKLRDVSTGRWENSDNDNCWEHSAISEWVW